MLEVASEKKEMSDMRRIRRMEGNFEDVGLRFPMSFLVLFSDVSLVGKKMLDLYPLVHV